jgi:hypothetical protein
MRAKMKKRRRACAFGTAPVPTGAPCETESARRSLACPSYAKCDVAIGRRVFAVSDRVVANVFGEDEDGLEAETRAYGVLREIQERNKEFKALDARLVMPTSPRFDAAHLLVDRYTPWSEYVRSGLAGHTTAGDVWGLVRQLQIMHEAGVAHGGVSAESVGVVAPAVVVLGRVVGDRCAVLRARVPAQCGRNAHVDESYGPERANRGAQQGIRVDARGPGACPRAIRRYARHRGPETGAPVVDVPQPDWRAGCREGRQGR